MPLRSALVLALLVSLSAMSAGATPPAAPKKAQASQKVQLRWKVQRGAPIGYEIVTQMIPPGDTTLRVDLATLKASPLTAQQRKALFEFQPSSPQSTMAVVLSPMPTGSLSAKVVLTKATMPEKPNPSKTDKHVMTTLQRVLGKVQLRTTLTPWGAVTSDMKREQRNLLALLFELPPQPVAVGDSWTHSADLVHMGAEWKEIEPLNRVELVALAKEAEGRTVAVVDITVAERQEGRFPDRRNPGQEFDGSMEMSFVGRGEFLVEEGRWRRLAGRMTTWAVGVMQAGASQQLTLTPLSPIPPSVLAAE